MANKPLSIDRSLMFSSLLDLSPEYRKIESRRGERITTAALEAWYASDSAHMHKFAQWWLSVTNLEDIR